MTGLFAALQSSAFSTWLRESASIWAFPTVLTMHTLGLMLLVGASWALDLRLLGIGRRIPLGPMRALFPVMWVGFGINAVSGSMVFAADATRKGASALFLLKLVLVAAGVVTMVLIKRKVYGAGTDAATGDGSARVLAVASIVAWTAAITAGRLLAYFP